MIRMIHRHDDTDGRYCPIWSPLLPKTRVPQLSCNVVCMILSLAVLIQYRRVTDAHTDRHTTTAYRASTASRGKNVANANSWAFEARAAFVQKKEPVIREINVQFAVPTAVGFVRSVPAVGKAITLTIRGNTRRIGTLKLLCGTYWFLIGSYKVQTMQQQLTGLGWHQRTARRVASLLCRAGYKLRSAAHFYFIHLFIHLFINNVTKDNWQWFGLFQTFEAKI